MKLAIGAPVAVDSISA